MHRHGGVMLPRMPFGFDQSCKPRWILTNVNFVGFALSPQMISLLQNGN